VTAAGLRATADRALLRVEGLEKTFAIGRSSVLRRLTEELHAVRGVSFDIMPGETFGLVGESGCGKSTVARCILRLLRPSGGAVRLKGVDLASLDKDELRRTRKTMQMVFQDSSAALDPRMSVQAIVEEPLAIHGIGTRRERQERVQELLGLVGIRPEQAGRKPHEFSGGQRQRIGIARALILDPELVVLDEPVSAVDVSIQAQILNLLRDLQVRSRAAYLFIVHDLVVAEYLCERLGVLYLGSVMELGASQRIFKQPLHPYTISLLSAVPLPQSGLETRRERIVLRGEATLASSTTGCPFQPRCPVGRDRDVCASEMPPLEQRAPDHWVACHFPGELALGKF
jgi:oligopeptide/dipeptide ABC transporter ATP-binding protein